MSVMDDLIEGSDITLQQILNNLLDAEKNLELKTHIFKPRKLTGLYILSGYLEKHNYTISSNIIKQFLEMYLKYMVSYKRLSRIEIIKALSTLIPESDNMPIGKKLTTNLKNV